MEGELDTSFGWVGQILRVDLSDGRISFEPTERYATQTLGGRGIGQLILFEELEPSTLPFSPKNKIVFSAGVLVGTAAPSAGLGVAAARIPEEKPLCPG